MKVHTMEPDNASKAKPQDSLDYIILLEPSVISHKVIRDLTKIAKGYGLSAGAEWDIKVVLRTSRSLILSGSTTKEGYESVYRCQVSSDGGYYQEMTPAQAPAGVIS